MASDNDDYPALAATVTSTATPPGSACHLPRPANVVIFNHPHLGIEDAVLHKRFLAHLFYSVATYWLSSPSFSFGAASLRSQSAAPEKKKITNNNKSVFYLTLAAGQWERWKGRESAQRHGLILLHRCPFQPPILPFASNNNNNSKQAYYQLRRHQTGKSFAAMMSIPTRHSLAKRHSDNRSPTAFWVCRSSPVWAAKVRFWIRWRFWPSMTGGF